MTFRAPTRDERWLAVLWTAGAAAALVLRPAAPVLARLAPACPIHALIGIPCATCGATRAALRLARLDWMGALALNPLATLLLTGAVLGGFVAPVWLASGGGVPGVPAVLSLRWRMVLASALLFNWIYLVARGI
jgi:hypothetical protein